MQTDTLNQLCAAHQGRKVVVATQPAEGLRGKPNSSSGRPASHTGTLRGFTHRSDEWMRTSYRYVLLEVEGRVLEIPELCVTGIEKMKRINPVVRV